MDHDFYGAIAAVLTTFCYIPQAIRTIRTRDTNGISFWMYVMLTLGVANWLAYGLVLKSTPIILANAVTLPLVLIILSIKMLNMRQCAITAAGVLSGNTVPSSAE